MKKIISLLLCIMLVLGSVSVAAAAESAAAEQCPYIFIHGFMAKDIVADKNDPDSDVLWPPSTDEILATVKECLPAILKFIATKNYDEFASTITDPVNELLGQANLDSDANPIGESGVYFKYPDSDSITPTSMLDFNYDWRLDPMELAAQLDEFIEYVCESSGCSQVVLECHSFGGVVTEAYTALYGSKGRIRSVCYNTSAVFGESYTGEMLSGNMSVDADSLTEFLKCKLYANENYELIAGILDILNSAGVTDDISTLGNKLIAGLIGNALPDILAPLFGGWPSIWAMCPDEFIEEDMEYIFGEVYGGNDEAHAGLLEKLNRYNEEIRPYKAQTLREQNEVSNLYVISRYNKCSVCIVSSWKTMSDSVVDTASSSFGATCAEYGSELDPDFVAQHKDEGLTNVENSVYAGTCMFPEQTWFIKDMEHSAGCRDLDNLALDLLYYNGQADIHTFENHPQYLKWSTDGSITPDLEIEAEELSLFEKMFGWYLRILEFFTGIKNKIFRR